jgi:predicted DsbA family dithiol-disulfide isomerase
LRSQAPIRAGTRRGAPGACGATSANAAWKRRSRARPRRIGYGIHALARAEGLGIDLHRARPVTTFDAHRLYQMGAEHGVGDAVLERLLRGYLCEGLNVGDPQVLERLGAEAGLDAARTPIGCGPTSVPRASSA